MLGHLLNARAQQSPSRAALVAAGERTSYGELQELSCRLAATLSAAGVGHRDRVGVYLPKGLAAYVSIFAVLELGAAYVPLDPSAPPARIRLILNDCGLKALITTAELARRLLREATPEALEVLVLDGPQPEVESRAVSTRISIVSLQQALASRSAPPANPATEDDLAYLLYTSGSTGRPKGVMISHCAALAFVRWAVAAIGLSEEDRVAGVAALHFDLSVFDLFATFAAGATLLPIPEQGLLWPERTAEWIEEAAISVWSSPSTLILLLEEEGLECREYPRLRHLLFAGEVFPTKYLRRLRRALPCGRALQSLRPHGDQRLHLQACRGDPEPGSRSRPHRSSLRRLAGGGARRLGPGSGGRRGGRALGAWPGRC